LFYHVKRFPKDCRLVAYILGYEFPECVINEKVPKEFRPIIAYHEFFEYENKQEMDDAHFQAIGEELKIAKQLDILDEYIEWRENYLKGFLDDDDPQTVRTTLKELEVFNKVKF